MIGAMPGNTPIIRDLQELTDEIGGRVTGSASNLAAVDWAMEKFAGASVPTTKGSYEMPLQWQQLATCAEIGGDVFFAPNEEIVVIGAHLDSHDS